MVFSNRIVVRKDFHVSMHTVNIRKIACISSISTIRKGGGDSKELTAIQSLIYAVFQPFFFRFLYAVVCFTSITTI